MALGSEGPPPARGGSSLPQPSTLCAVQRLSSKHFIFCFTVAFKHVSKLHLDVSIYSPLVQVGTTCLKHVWVFRN